MATEVAYIGAQVGFESMTQALADGLEGVFVHANRDALSAAMTHVAAILDASMRIRITDAMVEQAPELRVISCATTGADHIERAVLDRRGIPVHTLKEDKDVIRGLTPAAELSWCLLMSCARRLVPAAAHVRSGKWIREDFPGIMLRGKTLGVIGCGRIGSWMARYAHAFGMQVLGHDPYLDVVPEPILKVALAELLKGSDVISVHVPLNDETAGLVSADCFDKMKSGTIFINTSRGAVADETALLAALESGRLAAAGLDVLDGEPDIEAHPLVDYARNNDNLIITPHCGGFSPDAVAIVCNRAAEKINRYFG